MKKFFVLLTIVSLLLLSGCSLKEDELKGRVLDTLDPRISCRTLAEAEALAGFPLELKEKIGKFSAVEYRAIEEKLLEVTYSDGEHSIGVRRSPGEGQDLSWYFGAYEMTESFRRGDGTIKYKYLADGGLLVSVSNDGYSWCLLAYAGFPGRSCANFLSAIFG